MKASDWFGGNLSGVTLIIVIIILGCIFKLYDIIHSHKERK